MFEFSKRSARLTALMAVALFGLAVVVRTAAWWVMPWSFLEAVFSAALFFLYFAIKPIRRYFFSLPRPHQTVFASFFVLMLIGHFADRSWLTFPFPTWSMYTESDKSTSGEFFELHGLAPDGTPYLIDPGCLAGGGMMTFSMISKFRAAVRGAFFGERPDEARARHKENLAAFMRAAARVYNEERPLQRVEQIELHHIKIDSDKRGDGVFERRKLWDVSL